MADSLLFDGTDDRIRFSIGSAGVAPPATVAAIVKTTAAGVYQSIFGAGAAAAAANWLLEIYGPPSSGQGVLLRPGTAESLPGQLIEVADGWVLYAASKASGSAAVSYHRYEYGTTTWSHSAGSALSDWSAPGGQVAVGERGADTEFFFGNILICGIWNSTFADAPFEALGLQTGLSNWIAAAPQEAWRLDTMSTISSFTAGTSAETSRVGTTLDTGDVPAGWTDDVTQQVMARPFNPIPFL